MESKLKNTEKKKRKDFFTFFSELKEELKKVTWTTKADLISATKSVIIATFCFGLGIYGADLVIKGTLDLIKRIIYLIF